MVRAVCKQSYRFEIGDCICDVDDRVLQHIQKHPVGMHAATGGPHHEGALMRSFFWGDVPVIGQGGGSDNSQCAGPGDGLASGKARERSGHFDASSLWAS